MSDDEGFNWENIIAEEQEDSYALEDLVEWFSNHPSAFAHELVEQYDTKGYLSPKQVEVAQQIRDEAGDPVTSEGMYRNENEEVWKVVHNKERTRLYAKRWMPETGSHEYEGGAIYRLRGSMRMAISDAIQLGEEYGICCVCGRGVARIEGCHSSCQSKV